MERMLIGLWCLLLLARFTNGEPRLKLDGQERIVGGTDTTIGEHKWQVSFQHYSSHVCGGSIVAANWILTAAHCIPIPTGNRRNRRKRINSLLRRQYQIVAGTADLDNNGNAFNIKRAVIHSDYDQTTLDNDFALLQLTENITFDDTMDLVPLASTELTDGLVKVTGWGTTSEGGSVSSILQEVEVSFVTQADCNSAYSAYGGVTSNMICAGEAEGGKDSCQGDSGGPLTKDGVLYGVVSWGVGCALPEFPGVYAKVSAVKGWIEDEIA